METKFSNKLSAPSLPEGAGLGLRRSLLPELIEQQPEAISFFEVAPENWINVGGSYGKKFRQLTERTPLLCHGLSLSIGSPADLDFALLQKLKDFFKVHDEEFFYKYKYAKRIKNLTKVRSIALYGDDFVKFSANGRVDCKLFSDQEQKTINKITKTKIKFPQVVNDKPILEELNTMIKVHKKIAQENYKDNKIDIIIHYYLCSLDKGKIKLSEHEDSLWIEKKNFYQYDFVPGDKKIISLI